MKNVVIQGLPGIGKTTLVKKIANRLKEMTILATGFYTEEVRNDRNIRTGFEIVTLEDRRGLLARKSTTDNHETKYKVGNYDVYIEEFESVALPTFEKMGSIIIIDEIGKMELLSKKFEAVVEKVISDPNVKVVATVPLKGGGPLVQKLKNSNNTHLITVNAANRNNLLEEIISLVIK